MESLFWVHLVGWARPTCTNKPFILTLIKCIPFINDQQILHRNDHNRPVSSTFFGVLVTATFGRPKEEMVRDVWSF